MFSLKRAIIATFATFSGFSVISLRMIASQIDPLVKDLENGLSLKNEVNREVRMNYCPVCTLPHEYCEFGGFWKECSKRIPTDTDAGEAGNADEPETKPSFQKRGILMSVHRRGKHKLVTSIQGMGDFLIAPTQKKKTKSEQCIDQNEIKIRLVEISKDLKKLLSCGSSVSEGVIEIQGDVIDRLMIEIPKRYGDKFGMFPEMISIGKREKFR